MQFKSPGSVPQVRGTQCPKVMLLRKILPVLISFGFCAFLSCFSILLTNSFTFHSLNVCTFGFDNRRHFLLFIAKDADDYLKNNELAYLYLKLNKIELILRNMVLADHDFQ